MGSLGGKRSVNTNAWLERLTANHHACYINLGSSKAPKPDPAQAIAAQSTAESARLQAELAREQLAWAKETEVADRALITPLIEQETQIGREAHEDGESRSRSLFQDLCAVGLSTRFAYDAQMSETLPVRHGYIVC